MNHPIPDRICQLDWGRLGVKRAATRGDVVVIVDVLSFCTAVTAAVGQGGIVYAAPDLKSAESLARDLEAELAKSRTKAREEGGLSLSPLAYNNLQPSTRIVLPSRNGAACSLASPGAAGLLFGCLTNSAAVAERAESLAAQSGAGLTVIACGELEDAEDGSEELRFAIEDYLGAGSILSSIRMSLTMEAQICRDAFGGRRGDLEACLFQCESGRYLVERGFTDDVIAASCLNQNKTVGVLTANGIQS